MMTWLKSIFAKSESPTINLGLSEKDSQTLSQIDDRIVIGRILSIREHKDPKITKVRVTECEIAPGKTEQILCGGANIEEGAMVPIATIDADLGGGFIIGERDIRGEISRGMICAKSELGLVDHKESKGDIWLMPLSAKSLIGKKLKDC